MKYIKMTVCLLMAMLAAVMFSSSEAKAAEENIASGVIDEEYGQITWVIDSEGKLTVTGTGDVSVNTFYYRSPWSTCAEKIVSAEINVNNMTNAKYLFVDGRNITTVDLSEFDTSNVTDMSYMFLHCIKLTGLDVSGFDTSNVTIMTGMFSCCKKLEELDVSNFETTKVIEMQYMFESCDCLRKLDLSNFDMKNVKTAQEMFRNCDSLEQIEAPINCAVEVVLPVTSEDDKWYLPDGTVITTLPQGLTESVTIMKNQIPVASIPVNEVFADVPEGSWYLDAVQYVYDNGIMSGNGGLFTPNAEVTRAMVVETLYKMEGKPAVEDYTTYDQFSDLSRDHWWVNSVAWAMNESIATGDTYYKTFSPEASVTREQFATFLYRYAKGKGVEVTLSKDADEILAGTYVSDYAKEAFAWSVDAGLISGAQSTDANGNVSYDLAP